MRERERCIQHTYNVLYSIQEHSVASFLCLGLHFLVKLSSIVEFLQRRLYDVVELSARLL